LLNQLIILRLKVFISVRGGTILLDLPGIYLLKFFINDSGDCPGKQRRDGISDLPELLGSGAFKLKIIRKGLASGCLSDGERPALSYIGMYVVVPVLANVSGNG
jgi:hypothetical protein